VHPDGLDLRSQRATARQPGDERQLQGGDQLRPGLRDHQELGGIGVDVAERPLIRGQILGRAHAVPGGPELVRSEQVHNRRNVPGLGPPQNNGRTVHIHRRQITHDPKYAHRLAYRALA
jgi:hypothetical protein